MSNMSAYNAHLPCLNPNCKSHGRPHPNCRCYGFSGGGEVSQFCSEAREHNPDCEYFSGGGEALPSYEDVMGGKEPLPSYDQVMGGNKTGEKLPSYDEVMGANEPGGEDGYLGTAKAGAQGLLEGVIPFAAPIQVATGLRTKKDLAAEREAHPVAHGLGETAGFVGSLLTPMSAFGAIGKGAEAAAHAAEIGKAGSVLLKGAVQTASLAASDEMTKSLLGQGDPEYPVGAALLNVGAAGLLGGLSGGAFTLGEGLIGKGIASEAGAKAASEAQELLFNLGKNDNPAKMLGVTAATLATIPAYKTSEAIAEKTGLPEWMIFPEIEAAYIAGGYKAISKMNPYITAAAVKALSENEASGIPNVFHYVSKVVMPGMKAAPNGVSALFKAGAAKIAPPISEQARAQVKGFIEGGGVDKQLQNSMSEQNQSNNFAHGGQVKSEPNQAFSKVFPEQNTILSAAKGRISGYLNSLRPQSHQPKAVFDDAPSNKEQDRQYNKAIDLAISPLSILDHVNKGELTPEHMKHFTALYPEVHRFLSKEMTKQITEAQLRGEKPPFGKRQSMSLFLGADLDSSFSPVAVQTIQGLYSNKQAAQQQQVPTKNKKGTSSLEKSPSAFLTDEQARERRMQNSKS